MKLEIEGNENMISIGLILPKGSLICEVHEEKQVITSNLNRYSTHTFVMCWEIMQPFVIAAVEKESVLNLRFAKKRLHGLG